MVIPIPDPSVTIVGSRSARHVARGISINARRSLQTIAYTHHHAVQDNTRITCAPEIALSLIKQLRLVADAAEAFDKSELLIACRDRRRGGVQRDRRGTCAARERVADETGVPAITASRGERNRQPSSA